MCCLNTAWFREWFDWLHAVFTSLIIRWCLFRGLRFYVLIRKISKHDMDTSHFVQLGYWWFPPSLSLSPVERVFSHANFNIRYSSALVCPCRHGSHGFTKRCSVLKNPFLCPSGRVVKSRGRVVNSPRTNALRSLRTTQFVEHRCYEHFSLPFNHHAIKFPHLTLKMMEVIEIHWKFSLLSMKNSMTFYWKFSLLCTISVDVWGSAPNPSGVAHHAPQDPLVAGVGAPNSLQSRGV
jgi:hypothetical protein